MFDFIDETKNIILQDLEVDFNEDEKDESALIELIAGRVAEMLDTDTDLLFSYLYRLDIEESKIKFILNKQTAVPVHIGLATLIWERQKQRIETKKKYGGIKG